MVLHHQDNISFGYTYLLFFVALLSYIILFLILVDILISKKDSPLNISYPKTYNLYDSSDIEIISPKNGVLYNGDTIDFEYKTNTYKNLYIIISDKENNNFISMDRQGNIFKENEVLIYGQQVKISTKNPKSDLYDTII
mgnify:CR=1 FL=1